MAILVDVPGFAHMALLTERRHEVLAISAHGVPIRALGLLAAEAFVEHLSSADAHSTVLHEDAAVEFFRDVARSSPRPSR